VLSGTEKHNCQGRKKFVLVKNCKSPTFESKNIYGPQIHLKNCSFTEFERFSKNIAQSAKTNSPKIVRDGSQGRKISHL